LNPTGGGDATAKPNGIFYYHQMKFLEKDLEQIIYDMLCSKEGCYALCQRGLRMGYSPHFYKVKKQMNLGAYGIPDLIAVAKDDAQMYRNEESILELYQTPLQINIIELKKEEINVGTLIQAARYVKGVSAYFEKYHPNLMIEIRMVLIGREIKVTDWVYLLDVINNVSVFTYDYSWDGLKFTQQHNYAKTHDGFKLKKSKR